MITSVTFSLKENKVFLLALAFCIFLIADLLQAQNPTPPVFATVVLMKSAPGKELDLEKFMQETMKPVHQLRLKKGKIIGWYFFKVHLTGANDEYNYVSVHYANSWANTAPDDYPALLKEVNPKADPVQVSAKARELRTIVRQAIYYREENVTSPTQTPKFLVMDFMKAKPGMTNEYIRLEKEEWKKFHQYNVDKGKLAGWGFWSLVVPGGTSATHNFVTSNRYSTYAQAGEINYPETFKAVFPEVDPQAAFDKADLTRDLVKSEVWELIFDLTK
jgi:hypothetical protein